MSMLRWLRWTRTTVACLVAVLNLWAVGIVFSAVGFDQTVPLPKAVGSADMFPPVNGHCAVRDLILDDSIATRSAPLVAAVGSSIPAVRGFFCSLGLTFLVAMLSALFFTAAVRVMASRLGILDYPDGNRKVHSRPVALCGGVAVYLALLVGLVTATFSSLGVGPAFCDLAAVIGIAAGGVCLFGLIDDCRPLRSRVKLLLQIAVAAPIVAMGYWFDRVLLFGVPVELNWLGVPLTIFWLVACINALNLLDGMDGLAGTVGLITAMMMAVMGAKLGNPHVTYVAVALAGALAGFLIHNLPPARVFLGDSGSMVIGLVLGVLAIQGPMKTSTTLTISVPLVLLTLPILDTSLAVVRRKLTGRSLGCADCEHVHHRLLERGLGQWQALGVLGGICLVTGLAAIASILFEHDEIGWAAMFLVVVLGVRLRWFAHHELALALRTLARGLARMARWTADLSQRFASSPPKPKTGHALSTTAGSPGQPSAVISARISLWRGNGNEDGDAGTEDVAEADLQTGLVRDRGEPGHSLDTGCEKPPKSQVYG